MLKNYYIVILFLACNHLGIEAQTRYYVSSSGPVNGDGLSWNTAIRELRAALPLTKSGDEVWVAQGVYLPTADAVRDSSFFLPDGVGLYGGFAGWETMLEQRDIEAHLTVLSGDIGIVGDSTDNSYNVLCMLEPDSNTVLDGFIIRDGTADNPATASNLDRGRGGAGIYIMGAGLGAVAYPQIRNCTIAHNSSLGTGAGCAVNGTSGGSVAPWFYKCRFLSNHSHSRGGGLARIGGSWKEQEWDIDGCEFIGNIADQRGGGFYYVDSERSDRLDY